MNNWGIRLSVLVDKYFVYETPKLYRDRQKDLAYSESSNNLTEM